MVLSFIMSAMTREAGASIEKPVKGPKVNWVVLERMNYAVLSVFVGSLGYVIANYRSGAMKTDSGSVAEDSPMRGMMFPCMVLWMICLAYFFGFFGMSFLDKDALSSSPSSFGLDALSDDTQSSTDTSLPALPKPAPLNDGPICSDVRVKPFSGSSVPIAASTSKSDNVIEQNYKEMSDEEVIYAVQNGQLKDYQLEKKLGDCSRAVVIRRAVYENIVGSLDGIPHMNYDYDRVFGANCEIVVGYVPLPCGIVGPLKINDKIHYIPMATTEGCLVASTNRGCKALTASGGCSAVLLKDAITRAPCVRLPSATRAAALKKWCEDPRYYPYLEAAFNSTTNYGRLVSLTVTVAGKNAYLRFSCMSGDAMGMNMVSKGCLKAIEVLEEQFPDMVLVAISGNYCTDKKPAATNWILGRGKSVVVEAVIPEHIVSGVLKSTVKEMIETNRQKNLIGSAMAGSIGGFNAHAANIVTAVFLATGQDPAQNVESSNCLTQMDFAEDGESLHVSVTMPSVEVGTVGGGTSLPAQAACLDICGVRGASRSPKQPGDNAREFAQIVAASTLAGELSLMAALAANHLVRSHMQHNRKPVSTPVDDSAAVNCSNSTAQGDQTQTLLRKHASMPELSS